MLLKNICAAQLNSDKLNMQFRNSVTDILIKHVHEIDSNKIALAYFNADSVFINQREGYDNLYYSIYYTRRNHVEGIPDTSIMSKKLILEPNAGFSKFLDYMISLSMLPSVSSLQDTWIYVYTPEEEWQKFFIDYLLGYDSLTISTDMDFFIGKKVSVTHNRYRITFQYEKQQGIFKVQSDTLVRTRILKPA